MEAQKQIIEPILGLISPLFLAKNGPNTPKLYSVTVAIYTLYFGTAFGGHSGCNLGHFGASLGPIWRPHSKIWVIIGLILTNILVDKKGLTTLL